MSGSVQERGARAECQCPFYGRDSRVSPFQGAGAVMTPDQARKRPAGFRHPRDSGPGHRGQGKAGKERVTGGEIAESFGAIGGGRGHTLGTAGETVLARLPGTPALQRLLWQSPGGARPVRAAASDHAENRSIVKPAPPKRGKPRSWAWTAWRDLRELWGFLSSASRGSGR